jgi:hypothetical protein
MTTLTSALLVRSFARDEFQLADARRRFYSPLDAHFSATHAFMFPLDFSAARFLPRVLHGGASRQMRNITRNNFHTINYRRRW